MSELYIELIRPECLCWLGNCLRLFSKQIKWTCFLGNSPSELPSIFQFYRLKKSILDRVVCLRKEVEKEIIQAKLPVSLCEITSVHWRKKKLSYVGRLYVRGRRGYGLCGPVAGLRPAEQSKVPVAFDSMRGRRKVNKSSQLPAKTLGGQEQPNRIPIDLIFTGR